MEETKSIESLEKQLKDISAKTVLLVMEGGVVREEWERYLSRMWHKLDSEGYEVSGYIRESLEELKYVVAGSVSGHPLKSLKDAGFISPNCPAVYVRQLVECMEEKMMGSVDAVVYLAGSSRFERSPFCKGHSSLFYCRKEGEEKIIIVCGEDTVPEYDLTATIIKVSPSELQKE